MFCIPLHYPRKVKRGIKKKSRRREGGITICKINVEVVSTGCRCTILPLAGRNPSLIIAGDV